MPWSPCTKPTRCPQRGLSYCWLSILTLGVAACRPESSSDTISRLADALYAPDASADDDSREDAGNQLAFTLEPPETSADGDAIALRWTAPRELSRFTPLVRPARSEPFAEVAVELRDTATTIVRGKAWRMDWPTARAKIRGSTQRGACVDSNEQPLLDGVGGGANALGIHRMHAPDRVASPSLDPYWGAAGYVFERDASGTWIHRAAALPPVSGDTTLTFFAVALSADASRMALGAVSYEQDGGGGRVYVY